MKIADVGGIGPAQAEKLSAAGVVTDDDLLARGTTRSGRFHLASETGLSESMIIGWVRRIDLLRIDGIGAQHVDLLAAAGVDGRPELARRDAGQLAETLADLNRTRARMRDVPPPAEVAQWIEAARGGASIVED